MERPDRRLRQRVTDPLMAVALAGLSSVVNRLGPGPGYRVASAIGAVWYRLFRTRRRIIDRNLDIAFRGRLDPATKTHIGRACCQHALANVIEGLIRDRLIRRDNWREFCTIDPVLADALSNAGPRGLAVLSAHLGSWEMGLYVCGLFGKPLSPVVRTLDNPFLDRRSSQLRGRFGERIIRKSGALLGIMRELRGGGRVAIVADQSAPAAEGYQPFFGVDTATYSQYARVLVRQGCRVVFAVCVRDDFRFRFHTRSCELHVPETGSIDERGDALVRSYLAALEDAIQAHVEQYLWMHRRYKLRPHGAPSLYARLESELGAWAAMPVASDAGREPLFPPTSLVNVGSERPRP